MSEFEIAKIFKVKDSIAVIIPKKIAERINLENGQYVKISIKNGEIIIEKVFQNNKADTTTL
ncbi:MAG TPA: AbrB/MazE/SpoVT family DNA-binding domain-containing protein [Thermococcus sp.]|nr:AbrB/MazE/SpoVT family DNA-binding domain-containing protein [Thermococcus sp.]